MVAPCKDCPDRYVGCHGNCEKYKEYKAQLDSMRDQAYQIRAKEADLYERRKYAFRKMGLGRKLRKS